MPFVGSNYLPIPSIFKGEKQKQAQGFPEPEHCSKREAAKNFLGGLAENCSRRLDDFAEVFHIHTREDTAKEVVPAPDVLTPDLGESNSSDTRNNESAHPLIEGFREALVETPGPISAEVPQGSNQLGAEEEPHNEPRNATLNSPIVQHSGYYPSNVFPYDIAAITGSESETQAAESTQEATSSEASFSNTEYTPIQSTSEPKPANSGSRDTTQLNNETPNTDLFPVAPTKCGGTTKQIKRVHSLPILRGSPESDTSTNTLVFSPTGHSSPLASKFPVDKGSTPMKDDDASNGSRSTITSKAEDTVPQPTWQHRIANNDQVWADRFEDQEEMNENENSELHGDLENMTEWSKWLERQMLADNKARHEAERKAKQSESRIQKSEEKSEAAEISHQKAMQRSERLGGENLALKKRFAEEGGNANKEPNGELRDQIYKLETQVEKLKDERAFSYLESEKHRIAAGRLETFLFHEKAKTKKLEDKERIFMPAFWKLKECNAYLRQSGQKHINRLTRERDDAQRELLILKNNSSQTASSIAREANRVIDIANLWHDHAVELFQHFVVARSALAAAGVKFDDPHWPEYVSDSKGLLGMNDNGEVFIDVRFSRYVDPNEAPEVMEGDENYESEYVSGEEHDKGSKNDGGSEESKNNEDGSDDEEVSDDVFHHRSVKSFTDAHESTTTNVEEEVPIAEITVADTNEGGAVQDEHAEGVNDSNTFTKSTEDQDITRSRLANTSSYFVFGSAAKAPATQFDSPTKDHDIKEPDASEKERPRREDAPKKARVTQDGGDEKPRWAKRGPAGTSQSAEELVALGQRSLAEEEAQTRAQQADEPQLTHAQRRAQATDSERAQMRKEKKEATKARVKAAKAAKAAASIE